MAQTGRAGSKRTEPSSARAWLVAGCLAVVLASCSGGGSSLSEYAEEFDDLGRELEEVLDAGDVQMTTENPTLEDAQEVLASAVTARRVFQEGLTSLDPPDEFSELHADFVEVHSQVLAAQQAFSARAASAGSLEELDRSAEAEAYRAIGSEAGTWCEEFRARIDATADREVLADTPWIPSDMKEIVEVTFRC